MTEALLTALGYAIGPLIANRKLGDAPDLGVIAVCLAAAAVVYAPAAALTWPGAMPSAQVLAALAGLAVVCTAVAFVLFFRLIAEVGPARATVITYVNPGGGRGPRRVGARRAADPGDRGRVRADPRRLSAGHPRDAAAASRLGLTTVM